MSIVRVHKEEKYSVISNTVLNDKNLSWEARGVMAYLLSKPDGWECRNYDLINQGPAGPYVIRRVLKELQGAGYIYRCQKSDGFKIEWFTEIYETPELNTASRNANPPTSEEPQVGSPDIGELIDIVSTDLSKYGSLENTDKESSAKADFSREISFLTEIEIKEKKLTLAGWQQWLEDEKAERNRSGVIDFIEKKITIGPLLPDTPASKLLFEKLKVEAEAKGRRPPDKFPTLACKNSFDSAAARLNGTLETAIDKSLAQGITAIPKIVSYISSPKWQQKGASNGSKGTSKAGKGQPRTNGQTSQGTDYRPPIGSGRSPELQARLEAAFSRET